MIYRLYHHNQFNSYMSKFIFEHTKSMKIGLSQETLAWKRKEKIMDRAFCPINSPSHITLSSLFQRRKKLQNYYSSKINGFAPFIDINLLEMFLETSLNFSQE